MNQFWSGMYNSVDATISDLEEFIRKSEDL